MRIGGSARKLLDQGIRTPPNLRTRLRVSSFRKTDHSTIPSPPPPTSCSSSTADAASAATPCPLSPVPCPLSPVPCPLSPVPGTKRERRLVFRLGAAPLLAGSSRRVTLGLLERLLHRASGPTPGFTIRLLWASCGRLSPADSAQQRRPTFCPPFGPYEQAQHHAAFSAGAVSPCGSPARLPGVPEMTPSLHDPRLASVRRAVKGFLKRRFSQAQVVAGAGFWFIIGYGFASVPIAPVQARSRRPALHRRAAVGDGAIAPPRVFPGPSSPAPSPELQEKGGTATKRRRSTPSPCSSPLPRGARGRPGEGRPRPRSRSRERSDALAASVSFRPETVRGSDVINPLQRSTRRSFGGASGADGQRMLNYSVVSEKKR
jgi:hypothetical protein